MVRCGPVRRQASVSPLAAVSVVRTGTSAGAMTTATLAGVILIVMVAVIAVAAIGVAFIAEPAVPARRLSAVNRNPGCKQGAVVPQRTFNARHLRGCQITMDLCLMVHLNG